MKEKPETVDEVIERWPALTAHLIAESLGYATPSKAGQIILDTVHGRENWCEWIYSCYSCKPFEAVKDAIRNRHTHKGYMSEYRLARAIVDRYNATGGEEPLFASWF